mmetsp:Transcript_20773/g.64893  ORF Transcript_20773/g.64893 Transcript_20773/m.64893 type:complete len:212 (-) Transcript_20773:1521-2156(-)
MRRSTEKTVVKEILVQRHASSPDGLGRLAPLDGPEQKVPGLVALLQPLLALALGLRRGGAAHAGLQHLARGLEARVLAGRELRHGELHLLAGLLLLPRLLHLLLDGRLLLSGHLRSAAVGELGCRNGLGRILLCLRRRDLVLGHSHPGHPLQLLLHRQLLLQLAEPVGVLDGDRVGGPLLRAALVFEELAILEPVPLASHLVGLATGNVVH